MLWSLCEPVFGGTGPNAGLVEQSIGNVPIQRPGKMLCAPRDLAGRKLHRRRGRGIRIDGIAGTPVPGPAEKSVLDQKESKGEGKGKAKGTNKHKHKHKHSRIVNSSGASSTLHLFLQQEIKFVVVVIIIIVVTIPRKK